MSMNSPLNHSKKTRERLKKFASTNLQVKNPMKRWKALLRLFSKDEESVLKTVMEEDGDKVLSTLMTQLEEMTKGTGGGKVVLKDTEVFTFLELLEQINELVPLWELNNIGFMLSKCISTQNRFDVRIAAFKILINVINRSLQEDSNADIAELLDVFCCSLNWSVFKTEMGVPNINLKYTVFGTNNANESVAPRDEGEMPQSNEPIEMLAYLLDHIQGRVNILVDPSKTSFEFWLDQIHRSMLVELYPAIHSQMGYLSEDSSTGFPVCPYPAQKLLIDTFDVWKHNHAINSLLWQDKYSPFMVEVSKQSLVLPPAYKDTLVKSIDLYRYWLMTNRHARVIEDDHVHLYWQNFIKNISFVLLTLESEADQALFTENANKIFSVYREFSTEFAPQLDLVTWETLEFTLIDTLKLFFEKYEVFIPQIIDAIVPEFVNCLFFVWLRCPYNTEDHWRRFFEIFSVYASNQKTIITPWKSIILSLTDILCYFLYVDYLEEDQIPKPDFMGIDYTHERVQEAWITVLNISGNINDITVPHIFDLAMQCLSSIIDIIYSYENKLHIDNSENPCMKVNVVEIFLPWFFEACSGPEELWKGQLIAYQNIFKIYKVQHGNGIQHELFNHFYRTIRHGIYSSNTTIVENVMIYSSDFFSYSFPGCSILVLDFIKRIEEVISSEISKEWQLACINILSTLVVYPRHFNLPFVSIHGITSKEVPETEVLENITRLLFKTLDVVQEPECVCNTLWALLFLFMEEVHHFKPRMDILIQILSTFLQNIQNGSTDVALCALKCLSSTTSLVSILNDFDVNLGFTIIATLTSTLTVFLKMSIAPEILIETFKVITDWLLWGPNHFLTESSLLFKLLEAIELGLYGKVGDLNATSNLHDSPPHGVDLKVRDAAENCLYRILIYMNNYPTPAGPTKSVCVGTESEEESKYYYWGVHSDYELFSFSDVDQSPLSHRLKTHVFTRNPIGKYCWETEQLLAMDHNNLPPSPYANHEPLETLEVSTRPHIKGSNDLIHGLLDRFSKEQPQILPSVRNPIVPGFNVPLSPTTYGADIDNLQDELATFSSYESTSLRNYSDQRIPFTSHPHIVRPAYGKFESSRQFLSNFGYLARESRASFHTLEEGKRLERMIKDFDNIRDREVCRIGILYVGYGQEEQMEILANVSGSQRYVKFLQSVGWEVNLEEHTGFNGGLNAGTDGESSIYYCDDKTEVMFHVLTMMPEDEKDEKLVRRKRHVGNDHVHIVWSEHKRDYDASVIKSQFNDAHIIIYPLDNGLYRVSVYSKITIPDFGPLHDGMIINDEILGILVRLTAINANSSVRSTQAAYEVPYVMRKSYVKQVSDRHKFPEPAETMQTRFFPLEEQHLLEERVNVYNDGLQRYPDHNIALAPEVFITDEQITKLNRKRRFVSASAKLLKYRSISRITDEALGLSLLDDSINLEA